MYVDFFNTHSSEQNNLILDSPDLMDQEEQNNSPDLMYQEVITHYDLVICSILQRTQQTLKESKITYNNILITEEASESERTQEELLLRIQKFKNLLKGLVELYPKIAVIGHTCFLDWVRGI